MKTDDVVRVPVEGFPGYAVSADGKLWSCWKRGPGGMGTVWKVVKGGQDKDGYRKAILCRDGARFHVRVHHLILTTFVGPCPEGMEARHRNGVRDDNAATNLLWSTHVDNVADKIEHGTHQKGEAIGTAVINEATARKIKQLIADGHGFSEVCRLSGASRGIVMGIKYKKGWKHVTLEESN